MKKLLLAYLSLGLFAAANEPVAAMASQIRAEDGRSREVLVVNARDEYVFYLYGASNGRRDWENDILGEGKVLRPGASIKVDFWDGTNACNMDLKMVWRDRREAVRWNFNVCTELIVTFR